MSEKKKVNGDCYGTPLDLYKALNRRFDFTLDPCAWPENRLGTSQFYTEKENGLKLPWIVHGDRGHRVYANPPYSHPGPWIEKAITESTRGALVVMLLRFDPSTKWWRLVEESGAWIEPIPYRLKFVDYETKKSAGAYNFPSVLIIFHGLRKSDHRSMNDVRSISSMLCGDAW